MKIYTVQLGNHSRKTGEQLIDQLLRTLREIKGGRVVSNSGPCPCPCLGPLAINELFSAKPGSGFNSKRRNSTKQRVRHTGGRRAGRQAGNLQFSRRLGKKCSGAI